MADIGTRMSAAEFAAWDMKRAVRWELARGVPAPLRITAPLRRKRLIRNLVAALNARLVGVGDSPARTDCAIVTEDGQCVRKPDVVVGVRTPRAANADAPLAILEITPAGGDVMERVARVEEYKRLTTLRYLVLFDQDAPRMLVFSRAGEGWRDRWVRGPGARLALLELGVDIPITEIFKDIARPAGKAPAHAP